MHAERNINEMMINIKTLKTIINAVCVSNFKNYTLAGSLGNRNLNNLDGEPIVRCVSSPKIEDIMLDVRNY